MSKQASTIEWYTAQNDAEWESMCSGLTSDIMPETTTAIHSRQASRRFLSSVVAIFLLTATSGWWWRTAQAGLQQGEAEVRPAVELDVAAAIPDGDPFAARPEVDEWFQHAREVRDVHTAIQTVFSDTNLEVAVDSIDVQDNMSVARLVVPAKDGAPAFRQTHFYRRTADGWQPTAPDDELWGPVRRLETPSFVFHFRQNDAAAVIAAASHLEEIYNTLRHDFGATLTSNANKPIIEVSVTQAPGDASWFIAPERIVVASPARYQAPVELADADLLAQSLALPLLDVVLAQASRRHAPDTRWEPLLGALQLWEMWHMDLPLAVWRDDLVRWLYDDLASTIPGKSLRLPEHYEELCAAHRRWLLYPVQIGIPLTCIETKTEMEYLALLHPLGARSRLDQFILPVSADPYVEAASKGYQTTYAGQTIALATLIDYAVVTYGRERLPTLVASLGQYQRWDTLLPAAFGISAAEFEAGWQAYLMEQYNVDAAPPISH
jgi:hypothetical protein